MAKGAGDAIKGIFGTATGTGSCRTRRQGLHQVVRREYGSPPSQAAHTCYVQTLLYADAVNRAGTFYPPAVIKALEGFEFDGMGNGPTLYRAEDHQCFKDVLVVRGKREPDRRVRPARHRRADAARRGHLRARPPDVRGGELGTVQPGA